MGKCRWCGGTGTQYVELGSSLCYSCPDCGGNGYIPECDYCGEEYSGEYCENCHADCRCCGETDHIEADWEGLCEDCFSELEDLRKNLNDDTVVCRRCGSPVLMSINPEYVHYCPEHDEDLYLFETCHFSVYKKGEENGESGEGK